MFNKKITVYLILTIILFVIVLFAMLGEKVALNDGAGWDGVFYREVAYDFSNMLFNHNIDTYRIQRILPFSIINIVYTLFHIEKDNQSLMAGIQILNFIVLCIGVYYFILISKKLKLSTACIIIVFSTLFFNYPILKLIGYYPFQTDIYAFVISIMMFYFFISNSTIRLVIVSILGAFVWPLLLLCGLILAFFPNKELYLSAPGSKFDKVLLRTIKIGLAVIIPVLWVAYLLIEQSRGHNIQEDTVKTYNWAFVIVSLIVTPFYIVLCLRP